MGKGVTFSSDLLKLICNGTPIANLADNAASSPATVLYMGLHTADPSGGDQTTSEISYPGYARASVARGSSALLVSGAFVIVVADIAFPVPTGVAASPATFASLGLASSGTGKVLYAGAIASTVIEVGNAPVIDAGSTIGES